MGVVMSGRFRFDAVASAALFGCLQFFAPSAHAQLVPPRADLTGIVKDENWARVLGKALFWDANAGSDGLACASCHYSAGADSRIVNGLNPGQLRLPTGDTAFGAIASFDGELLPGAPVGRTASGVLNPDATYTLSPADFPLHQLTNKLDRDSALLQTTNDSVSSSGSFDQKFHSLALSLSGLTEKCSQASGNVYHGGVKPARMVEPRNTPTTINAAFNHVNFWDGRANNIFNGVGVFGRREIASNPAARVLVREGSLVRLQALEIPDASLASQAVGPALSNEEMSCSGRRFLDIARKLLLSKPLAGQKIHAGDSLFGSAGPHGSVVASNGRGLNRSYLELITRAFDEKYWNSSNFFVVNSKGKISASLTGHAQVEHNFAMFWGISIMLYEQTLISDQSRFDSCNPRTVAGVASCQNEQTLTTQELQGFALFNNFGRSACSTCHAAPTFSEAQRVAGATFLPIERSRIDNPTAQGAALHDRGFFNIGARPASVDPGVGGKDPFGAPLSASRMFLAQVDGLPVSDPVNVVCNQTTDVAGGGRLIEPGGTPTF